MSACHAACGGHVDLPCHCRGNQRTSPFPKQRRFTTYPVAKLIDCSNPFPHPRNDLSLLNKRRE